MFDWLTFFNAHNIPYADKGPNVSKGNIVTKCPFCGPQDPSFHLSVSTANKGWRCLRAPDAHVGKSPVRLVAALLNCSFETAARLTGVGAIDLPEDFIGKVNSLLGPGSKPPADDTDGKLELLAGFKPFSTLPSCRPYLSYMKYRRGILPGPMLRLANQFDLRYAPRGRFHHRVIFPVHQNHRLVTWTGRAIDDRMTLRYLSLSPTPDEDDDLPPALAPISDCLLWSDLVTEVDADTLCICEGPMDALKVWHLGQAEGVVATCFFTASWSIAQKELLIGLLPRFRRKLLLLDRGTTTTALRLLWSDMQGLGLSSVEMPADLKDPGEMRNGRDLRRVLGGT